MVIQFLENSDKRTCSLVVDYQPLEEQVWNEIPYVPNLLVDCRGSSLFMYINQNYTEVKIGDFDKIFDLRNSEDKSLIGKEKSEIKRGWNILFYPLVMKKKKKKN